MQCERFKMLINEYIDGTLSESDKTEFEQHMRECDKCAQLCEQTQKTVELLKGLPDLKIPENLVKGTKAKAATYQSHKPKFNSRFGKIAVSVAAAVIVVCVGTVVLLNNQGAQPDLSSKNMTTLYDSAGGAGAMQAPEAGSESTLSEENAGVPESSAAASKNDTADMDSRSVAPIEIIMPDGFYKSEYLEATQYEKEGDSVIIKVTDDNKTKVQLLIYDLNLDLDVKVGSVLKFEPKS